MGRDKIQNSRFKIQDSKLNPLSSPLTGGTSVEAPLIRGDGGLRKDSRFKIKNNKQTQNSR
jgi:hypothetical protein